MSDGGPWTRGEPPPRRRSLLRLIGRIVLYVLAVVGGLTTAIVAVVVALAVGAAERPADLPDKIVLSIDLNEGAPERRPISPFARRTQVATLRDVVDAVVRAKDDPDVVGVVARLSSAPFGMARAQELRDAILEFAQSGKTTALFSETLGGTGNGTVEYFVASAFDEIWLQPSGTVGLTGIALQIPFLKGTLDSLEIETRFEQRHEYKSASESILRANLSEPARRSLQTLVDGWMDQIVDAIAAGRDLEPDAVRALIDGGPHLPDQALQSGLVDQAGYWDQFVDDLTGRPGWDDAEPVGVSAYLGDRGRPGQDEDGPAVALIHGVGAIGVDEGDDGPFGNRGFGAAQIADILEDISEDDEVAGVILRIDSPGGAYVPADVVWRAIHKVRESGKPVIASMGDTAASGGYFVAMAADRVIAQPGTITGSIGVYGGKLVTERFWEKLGVTWDGVHAGARATMWSMVRDFPPGAEEKFSELFDFVYEDFTGKAGADRGLTPEQMDLAARGRVWTGRDAQEVGLVDALGGLRTASREMRLALGLEPDAPLNLMQFPPPRSRFEMLAEWFTDGDPDAEVHVMPAADAVVAAVARQLRPVLGDLSPLLERREGLLQLPPMRLQ